VETLPEITVVTDRTSTTDRWQGQKQPFVGDSDKAERVAMLCSQCGKGMLENGKVDAQRGNDVRKKSR